MPPPDAPADASGSSSDDEDAYVPYARRPEWADVTPLEQPEPARPIVAIDYRPEYVDAHDTFRAVRASGEVSRRALDLTAECLKMNGANYTVWHERWALVEALAAAEAREGTREDGEDGVETDRSDPKKKRFSLELAYATKMALANPKNYQVWNHMRLVSQALGATCVAQNLDATARALALDAKNIHAWTHRGWIAKTFGKKNLAYEKTFAAAAIDADPRNNSAWNQRFAVTFVFPFEDEDEDHREEKVDTDETARAKTDEKAVLFAELAFAEAKIALAPDNESAWNYLRGVARLPAARADGAVRARTEEIARRFCPVAAREVAADASRASSSEAHESGDGPPSLNTRAATSAAGPRNALSETNDFGDSRHAISLLADSMLRSGAREAAAALYSRLVGRDPIRANYWTLMIRRCGEVA